MNHISSDNSPISFSRFISGAKQASGGLFYKIRNAVFGRKTIFAGNQDHLDKKLVYSLSKSRIPKAGQFRYLGKFLNAHELRVMRLSFLLIIASLLFLAGRFYIQHLEVAPKRGGDYVEALVGGPKHINPLYASINDADSDIGRLVFSSLMAYDGRGGLKNDLADSYEIGADNKTYVFKIKKDVKWHNGARLTVDDVLFTFYTIKNPQFKSPLRQNFSGVEAERVDDETVKFTLAESYAPFLELLTFGIMPQELWYQVSPQGAGLAELNLKPVGSGPYKFKSLIKDKAGQVKSYTLAINDDYYGAKPKIENLTFKFYANFEEALQALNDNAVEGVAYLPKNLEGALAARNSFHFFDLTLPELTAVFFNQKNNAALSDLKVRQALAFAIDKQEIVDSALQGEAKIADGPLPSGNFAYNPEIRVYGYNQSEAAKLLDEAGWKVKTVTEEDLAAIRGKDEQKLKQEEKDMLGIGVGTWRYKDKSGFLAIRLTTVDTEAMAASAGIIKKHWDALQIKTTIETAAISHFQSEVLKSRDFEALFYGQMLGHDPDAYAFWHSSQTGELGANISGFSNKQVDELLEDGRLILDRTERIAKYKDFQKIITDELPAIFIYSPVYTYLQDKKVKSFGTVTIQVPADRFNDVVDWHIKTKKRIVW